MSGVLDILVSGSYVAVQVDKAGAASSGCSCCRVQSIQSRPLNRVSQPFSKIETERLDVLGKDIVCLT
jgi:hypothetical protein